MRHTKPALAAVLVLFVVTSVQATEYHLYSGGSLNSALVNAQPGDIITMHAGTYSRPGNQSGKSGTANAWITIRGAPGEARPRIYHATADKNIFDMTNCNYIKWQGLEIEGGVNSFRFNGTCHDIIIEDVYAHHIYGQHVNASGITELYNLTVRDCEFSYSNGTGESFYLGKHAGQAGKQVHHALIERNYIHHMRTTDGQGDAIELKHGCHSIIIQDNAIMADANYPAITTYGTFKGDPAYNPIVRRNFIYGSSTIDASIFTEGEINIENNVIVNSLTCGISIRQRDDGVFRDLKLVNNTFYGGGSTLLALRNGNIGTNIVIANNAFIQNSAGKAAMIAYHGLSAGTVVANNVAYGTVSGFPSGVTMASSPADLFANPILTLPSAMDFYPKAGSMLLDAGSAAYAPADDFNLLNRPVGAAADVGAYEVHSQPTNPGWQLALAIKDTGAAILPGDFNFDGAVDVVDLLTFVDAFGSVAGDASFDAACDLNADGFVDVVDLLTFVDSFGMAV
jgi:hypothetical protein